jgi:hypothetical protein
MLATIGSASVHMPAEELSGDPQNLLGSSHSTTPDQLLVNTLSMMVSVVMPMALGTPLFPPDSDIYMAALGNAGLAGPPWTALPIKVLCSITAL